MAAHLQWRPDNDQTRLAPISAQLGRDGQLRGNPRLDAMARLQAADHGVWRA
jgi:hypothetical protein